eukprot:scaffold187023_cov31-Tisochrysis_lutea.AAC.7
MRLRLQRPSYLAETIFPIGGASSRARRQAPPHAHALSSEGAQIRQWLRLAFVRRLLHTPRPPH